jgi:hypothetical protein
MLGQFQLIDPAILRGLGYILLFTLVAPLFPLAYVVLRWRVAGRDEQGIGSYGALLYFRTVALLVAIAGAANLSYGILSTTPIDPALTRLSWGMLLGGGIFLGLNVALGRLFTVVGNVKETRRVFAGFLMIISGLVTLFVLVLLFLSLFVQVKEGDADAAALRIDDIKFHVAWAIYFLATYLNAAIYLARTVT